MTPQQLTFFIPYLNQWAAGDYQNLFHKKFGICLNLSKLKRRSNAGVGDMAESGIIKLLTPYYKSWSLYSGNLYYPVPSPDYIDPWCAYWEDPDAWAQNAYGDARRDLCRHLSTEFTKTLKRIRGISQ